MFYTTGTQPIDGDYRNLCITYSDTSTEIVRAGWTATMQWQNGEITVRIERGVLDLFTQAKTAVKILSAGHQFSVKNIEPDRLEEEITAVSKRVEDSLRDIIAEDLPAVIDHLRTRPGVVDVRKV